MGKFAGLLGIGGGSRRRHGFEPSEGKVVGPGVETVPKKDDREDRATFRRADSEPTDRVRTANQRKRGRRATLLSEVDKDRAAAVKFGS